jgi:hypothetical protein
MNKQQIKFYTEMTAFNRINFNRTFETYMRTYRIYIKNIDLQVLDYAQEQKLNVLLDKQKLQLNNMLKNK